MIRLILIAAGTLCLLLGLIGIVVPGLPTTPFLLLTAGFYIRSSDRLYQALVRNKYVGRYITDWQATRRLSVKTKIASILLMWTMITLSVIFMVDSPVLRHVIIGVGVIGTIIMGLIIPSGK